MMGSAFLLGPAGCLPHVTSQCTSPPAQTHPLFGLLLLLYNFLDPFPSTCRDGFTALHVAAAFGDTACMQLLLDAHDPAAQVRAVDKLGRNTLILACHGGHTSSVSLLLSACGGSLAAAQCQAVTR